MKKTISFIISFLSLCPVLAQQDDNWETYMAEVAKKPASVLVNLALYDRSPDRRLPYLLITGPKSKKCMGNGLPEKDEIPKLEEILDAADAFITGITPKILAGTFTYNCERVNYYYVKDTLGLDLAITRLYKRSFDGYSYIFKIKTDPDWGVYRDFLYPTEENFTWIENNKIITKLIAEGDDLSKTRDINFVLLFKTEAERKSFIDFAHRRDYRIDELNYIKNADMPYRLKMSRSDAIKPDVIADLTNEIKKEAKKHNAQYEAWNCEIVK